MSNALTESRSVSTKLQIVEKTAQAGHAYRAVSRLTWNAGVEDLGNVGREVAVGTVEADQVGLGVNGHMAARVAIAFLEDAVVVQVDAQAVVKRRLGLELVDRLHVGIVLDALSVRVLVDDS